MDVLLLIEIEVKPVRILGHRHRPDRMPHRFGAFVDELLRAIAVLFATAEDDPCLGVLHLLQTNRRDAPWIAVVPSLHFPALGEGNRPGVALGLPPTNGIEELGTGSARDRQFAVSAAGNRRSDGTR